MQNIHYDQIPDIPVDFFEIAQEMSPALKVVFPDPENDWVDICQSEKIARIYHQLRASYPNVETIYPAVRTWLSLIWQPCYLSVLSLFRFNRILTFGKFRQRLEDNQITGYDIESITLVTSERSAALKQAFANLDGYCQFCWMYLNQLIRFKRTIANRLFADTILYAHSALTNLTLVATEDKIVNSAELWLKTMQIKHSAHLIQNKDSRHTIGLKVKRFYCCMHFMVNPQATCSNCPKLDTSIKKRFDRNHFY